MQGRQTAVGYVQMWQRASVTTEGPHLCGDVGVSTATEGLLQGELHPPFGPSCMVNPIEIILDGRFIKMTHQFRTVDALCDAIFTTSMFPLASWKHSCPNKFLK